MIAHPSIAGAELFIAKSSLLLAIGWCASRAMHRASAAARHLVWLTVIVGVLFIPIVGQIAPVPFRILPARPATQSVAATELVSPIGGSSTRPTPLAVEPPRVKQLNASSSTMPRLDPERALVVAWVAIALVLSARLFIGMLAIGRLARRGEELDAPVWRYLLEDAARQIDVSTLPRLVMSDQVDMAFTFHAASPAIILPASAREWSKDRRQAVLLHELAHIQRHDLLSHAVAGFVCALNWFNPFIWAAARQLRVESEMASDEIVIGAGIRPSVYAQHLLDMVTGLGRRAPAVALAMARPKEFEGRLVAILDPARRHPSVARRRGALVALVALPVLAIGAAAPAPRASAAQRQSSAPASIPRGASSQVDRGPSTRNAAPAKRPEQSVVGSGLSRGAVASLLRFGTAGVINPMMMLLRDADSLNLTGAQADSIASLNRHYMIRLSRIWSPVSGFYVTRTDTGAGPLPPAPGADPTQSTIQALAEAVRSVDEVLTPEQRRRVAPTIGAYLDLRGLNAIVAGAPDGVFMSPQQVYAIRGYARGGG